MASASVRPRCSSRSESLFSTTSSSTNTCSSSSVTPTSWSLKRSAIRAAPETERSRHATRPLITSHPMPPECYALRLQGGFSPGGHVRCASIGSRFQPEHQRWHIACRPPLHAQSQAHQRQRPAQGLTGGHCATERAQAAPRQGIAHLLSAAAGDRPADRLSQQRHHQCEAGRVRVRAAAWHPGAGRWQETCVCGCPARRGAAAPCPCTPAGAACPPERKSAFRPC